MGLSCMLERRLISSHPFCRRSIVSLMESVPNFSRYGERISSQSMTQVYTHSGVSRPLIQQLQYRPLTAVHLPCRPTTYEADNPVGAGRTCLQTTS